MSYMLINKMTTNPGKRDEVIDILIESGKAFDDNQACKLYLISKDKHDDTVIWVQDVWTDEASHRQAMSTDAMKNNIQKAMPLLDGMPEQIDIEPAGGKSSVLF